MRKISDPDPFADGSTIIVCYGGATFEDIHTASTIHCIDGEIFEWLDLREARREKRKQRQRSHAAHLKQEN
jgi:hypothetical protein